MVMAGRSRPRLPCEYKCRMQLPEAVTSAHEPDAVALLRRYYQEVEPGFSGRHFDGWDPAGRRSDDKNRFTSDDLVAVTFLSLAVPPRGAYRVLVTQRDELNALLAQVPDVDLADVPEGVIDEQWPAWRLWELLRAGHDGIGWVTAGKLLAYKRPRLIPVYDDVVQSVVGAPASFWQALHQELRRDDQKLQHHLLDLREQAGIGEHVSPLRVFDVIAWMTGKRSV